MGDAVDTVSKPLLLAFLAHPGFEHYDAVTNVTGKVTGPISTSTGSPRRKTKTPTKNKGRSPSTTPRKKAEYNSPGKRKTSRKRICDPSKWVKTIRKEQRNMGKRYISPGSKNIIPAKSLKSRDCSDCRYQCSKTLTLDIQQKIFDSFYCKEMTFERKRDFICRHIDVKPTSNRNRKTYKQNARAYYLPCRGKLVRVCKAFFLSTLAVSDKLVRCTLARKEHGIFSGTDQRGKHQPANKTENVRLSYVKLHIESFPAVDSHYKRKSTQRKFLETGLSINRMYDLYREKCENDKVAPVSASVYRNIFCSQYNLSFHKPKKDTCAFCNTYMEKEKSCTATDMDKKSYQDHLRRKEIARTEKEKDKELSKKSKSIYAATFDMQAVLSTPCSNVSKVYYKRKLNCYNMSVFSLSDKSGTCYLWDESNGQRGSSEIGSCLITHINGLPSTVKHVILYSDCCSGQNRNQYLAAGLNHTVNSSHVEIIEQKFLESGHTQMECDSMHSAIEHAKKGTSIFHPDQWDMVVHMARRGKPYTVVPMRFDNIKDLKEYTKQECVGLKFDSEGRRVNWLKIKVLRVAKEFPNGILVKESFEDEDFRFVPLNSKSTRGRPPSVPRPLPNKYTSQLPISVAKKNDLLSLCDNLIIPALYRPFYEGLATNKLLKDRLPEPDMLEDDEDSD